MSNYNLRDIKLGIVIPVAKVKTPIAKVSEKRKEEMKVYNKLKSKILKADNRCKIKSPVCTGEAQGLDHLQKRTPSNLTKESNVLAACNACNLYKELHPVWANNNGFSISKFKPVVVVDEVNDTRVIVIDQIK